MKAFCISGIVTLVCAVSAATAAAVVGRPRAVSAGPRDQVVRLGGLGRTVPRSFIGMSFETNELQSFEQRVPAFAAFLSLLRAPGQGPVSLRVGGESADESYLTAVGFRTPAGRLSLDQRWLDDLAATGRDAHASVIVDLNGAARSPTMAAALARATSRALPAGSLRAFEIGNEPDLYRIGLIGFMRFPRSDPAKWPADLRWASSFGSADYAREFSSYATALGKVVPHVPLAGPSSAEWHDTWVKELIAHGRPKPGLLTTHRYPLSACAARGSAQYPTVGSILSPSNPVNLSRSVHAVVADGRRAGVPVRITELGSATCGGIQGASDTLAVALWAPDVLFRLAWDGVEGVNVHTRFTYPNTALHGTSSRPARPLFYGMLAFTRMLGPGARLQQLKVSGAPNPRLTEWAVRLRDGTVRLLLDNKGAAAASVLLELGRRGPALVQRLSAPSVRSSAVSLAGRTLDGAAHWDGRLRASTAASHNGAYRVAVPAYSAALVFAPRS